MTRGVAGARDKLSALSKEKAQLLKFLLDERSKRSQQIPRDAPPDAVDGAPLPASWAQQRLWFIDRLEGGSAAYHIPLILRMRGDLVADALKLGLQRLVERHDVLRTVFVNVEGEPRQRIAASAHFSLPMFDLREYADPARAAEVQRHAQEEGKASFDLETGPLIRGRLLRIADQEYLLLITIHHIISDGWSTGILIRELSELYSASVGRREAQIDPLPIQYADYARWQREWLQGDVLESQLTYWKECLHGAAPVLELPMDRARPNAQSYRGGSVEFHLGGPMKADLQAFAQRRGMTVFMVLCTAWASLLSRLSGQEDVIIGTPIANRRRAELENLIGFFVNTLPLRIAVGQDLTVEELLADVKALTLGAYAHSEVPFEKMVEAVQPQRTLSRNPIFQVMLSVESTPVKESPFEGLIVTAEEGINECSMFDLFLLVKEEPGGFLANLTYASDLFDRETVVRWTEGFSILLTEMLATTTGKVAELPILSSRERFRIIESFNDTQASYPKDALIHELFEGQVNRTPDAIAVECGAASITYGDLNRQANQLARYLRRQGVGPDQVVGICVERGVEMVVGLLGILKAGGAYLPLDPAYPTERLAYMLADAAPVILLTQHRLRETVPRTFACPVVSLDRDWNDIAKELTENLDRSASCLSARHLAYVIYTSGSTGRPKGVGIEHRNTVNLIWWAQHTMETGVFSRMLHSTSLNFDLSVYECFVPLSVGGSLRVIDTALDLIKLQDEVTLINTVPSVIKGIVESGRIPSTTRVVNLAGETLRKEVVDRIFACSDVERVCNLYGPSETTTYSTWIDMPRAGGFISSIGRPIANTQVYILDRHRQVVPIGVVGEIYIGGDGVARGYLNLPELTAERFILDPFRGEPAARMYKTGDVARWRSDGTIEYLGRNDSQVKVRGFRIELGEIEGQLLTQAHVKEAVVLAREDVPDDKRLVAYIVPRPASQVAPGAEALRTHLKAVLPSYMVPSAFVVLEHLPLTASGKLDRRALPAPELGAYPSQQFESPQGELEEILAGVWRELLHVERVGRHDNFFALGGHSLLIVQMMERLRRLELSADLRHVFESATLADLARVLTSKDVGHIEVPPNEIPTGCRFLTPQMLPLVALEAEHIQQIVNAVPGGAANIQDIYPLAPLQEGILFHHLLNEQGGDAYVLATVLSVSSRQRLDELIEALQTVINRHDALRTAILWEGLPRPVQVVYREVDLAESVLTVGGELDEEVDAWIEVRRQRLDLRRAPLLRLQVARESDRDEWRVLLQLHHIICDNTSHALVISEVVALLDSRATELLEPMPYRRHVAHSLVQARSHDAESFFRSKLGAIDQPTAPFGLVDVHGNGGDIAEAQETLDLAFGRRLRSQARAFGVSVATLFHAGWALVVAHTSGRDDVVFGTVLLGRLQGSAGAERILGMFINTLPLRVRMRGLTARGLLEHTQRELVELLTHEQASLAAAQRCSGIAGAGPLFTTLLNYRHHVSDSNSDWERAAGIRLLAGRNRTNYPIALSVDDLEEAFRLTAQTDRRVDPKRITGYLHTALVSLIEALESASDATALELVILPEIERRQVLNLFNATEVSYSQRKRVHQLFEDQVGISPAAVAVVYEGRSLTYAELNRKANRLAQRLRARNLAPGQLVGICVTRSLEMVVGLLGVLKAGGAYVPLDPNYPPERLQHMLADANPHLVLIQEKLRSVLPDTTAQVIPLDEASTEDLSDGEDNLFAAEAGLGREDLVYVIYTSGSTGWPKGVAMPHRAMVNLIDWHRKTLAAPQRQRVLQFAALSFDVAFQECFTTLCTGGTLVLLDEWVRQDAGALTELLNRQAIERLFLPPLMLQSVAEYCQNSGSIPRGLRDVITAGEQLRISPEIVGLFKRLPGCRLHNHYGPTETHVVTALTLDGAPDHWPALPSIGRPISNTQIYVLDARRRAVPIGVTGEIYIGGAGVARGYLNRDELTAQRFVVDAFSTDATARLYRTGDLGRWRGDGALDYLGRNDDQVKIRGFRIELGEIEAQVARNDKVKEVVVIAREDVSTEKRLVAYVIPREANDAPNAESLREHLKSLLPDYMVPSAFVQLERFPLTPNGKLDRRALPAPKLGAYASRQYEAPQGEVEEILAAVWRDLLRVERVGRWDNFFQLGGHSLLIVQMMERLRRRGLAAKVRSVYDSPTLSAMARIFSSHDVDRVLPPPNAIPLSCDNITPAMLPLVTLESQHLERIVQSVPGGAANIKDIYPLTAAQEGMLFHHLLDTGADDAYARQMLFSLASRDELEEFIAALQQVTDRHDVLRTAVLWERLPLPVQVVYREARLPVERIALRPDCDPIQQLQERMGPTSDRLDLGRAPLLRLKVAQCPGDPLWYVLLQTHHMVFDNHSLSVMLSEVMAYVNGTGQELPEPIPFRNYVAHALAHSRTHDAKSFFRSKLADVNEPTVPFGLLDVHGDGSRMQESHRVLESSLSERLRGQARERGVSAATLFHAAWALVVSRTSNRDDVVFGTVLLGRMHSDTETQQMLGMFMNTLPLRLKLRGVSTAELVEQTQRELVDLLSHEQASLAEAQQCSGVSGSVPLFSALLNYRHSIGRLDGELASARGMTFLGGRGGTNYPIALSVEERVEGFTLQMETDPRIDPRRVLEYVHTALRSLLEALEGDPTTPARALAVLSDAERRSIVETFNATHAPPPPLTLIHELIEAQVALSPGAVAIAHEEERVTYAQLNSKANRLARYLRDLGVGPDQRVAICVERSVELVIGLLGILKSGGSYVPLDPTYPAARLRHMLKDAAPRVLLTQERLISALAPIAAHVVCLDDRPGPMDGFEDGNLDPRSLKLTPRNLAYVIYTSGSTGTPKGVMVEHAGVVNLLVSMKQRLQIGATDRLLAVTTVSFDIAGLEIYLPLISGAQLVLASRAVVSDATRLAEGLESGITILQATPSAWRLLLSGGWRGRSDLKALCGGEALNNELAANLLPKVGALWNLYGPTETTIWSSARQIEALREDGGTVESIGSPIANTQIYILDPHLEIVPIGVVGEICIGGVGVARGYLNKPELTAARFVVNPFSSDARARMYRTGDLGRWRADGSIEYIGRDDHQVKIRGFRIEPGEIESQLLDHPQIKEALVIAREDALGDKRLVAYMIPVQSSDAPAVAIPDVLRTYLRGVLPEHMVPSAFVMLECWPLTLNGKLDRGALPLPERMAFAGSLESEDPQGAVEEALAGIWREVLGLKHVGRNDDFFALGGHSLSAMRVIIRVRQSLGIEATPRILFSAPTLEVFAKRLETLIWLRSGTALTSRNDESAHSEEGAL